MTVDIESDIPKEVIARHPNATGEYIDLLLGALRRGDYQMDEIRKIFDELKAAGLAEDIAKKIQDSLRALE
jgi:hypothetical protein